VSNPFQELAVRATSDAVFRTQAKSDPRAALESVGLTIPSGVRVEVFENGPSTLHVVLPEKGDISAVKTAAPNIVKVFEKAWSDPAFKAQLLNEPKQAIKAATNATVPASLDIVVHENTATDMSFVLPYVPPASGELSDVDLEMVSGGKGNPSAGGCGHALETQGAIVTASGAVAVAGGATGGVVSAGAAVVAVGTMFSSFVTMAVSASK
jgi:hypothetical protein